METNLIITDRDKCEGCNKCIRNCPVEANIAYLDNGKVKVKIDYERCINCGKCLEVCDHNARDYYDDTERFFKDLKNGVKITLIAAPAVRANFGNYKNLFGYFKSIGVNLIYDVSFGADITTWAYLKMIKDKNISTLIAQPCPAVVSYVEKYQSQIINNLSPIHSPMMCTVEYLRKYKNDNSKLAFLSPCIAKKNEMENTNDSVSYNVTYKKLADYLKNNNINIANYKEKDFDDIGCELGFLFSRPGGLRENIEAVMKDAWVKQVEGPDIVYKYLSNYNERVKKNKPVPLVVDALNCTHGCNIGSAVCITDEALDDIDYLFN
ncbi:MAG: [Fe-Fe] hydrogenase large subunit C-terminal domain-containing protein, partial [Eubacteriales bacterium]